MIAIMDPLDQPGLAPPPGVTPNFNDPFSLQPYNILTIAICFALTTPSVAARLYTRYFIIKSVGWEDCKSTHSLDLPNLSSSG